MQIIFSNIESYFYLRQSTRIFIVLVAVPQQRGGHVRTNRKVW